MAEETTTENLFFFTMQLLDIKTDMYHEHNLENTTMDYKMKYKRALDELETKILKLERCLQTSKARVCARKLRSETDDASDALVCARKLLSETNDALDALVSKQACENWKARMLADCEACTVTDPLIRFNKEDIYYFHNGLHV